MYIPLPRSAVPPEDVLLWHLECSTKPPSSYLEYAPYSIQDDTVPAGRNVGLGWDGAPLTPPWASPPGPALPWAPGGMQQRQGLHWAHAGDGHRAAGRRMGSFFCGKQAAHGARDGAADEWSTEGEIRLAKQMKIIVEVVFIGGGSSRGRKKPFDCEPEGKERGSGVH